MIIMPMGEGTESAQSGFSGAASSVSGVIGRESVTADVCQFGAGGQERIRVMRLIARLSIGGPARHTMLLTERLDPARFDSLLVTGVGAAHEGSMLDLMGHGARQPLVIPSLGRDIALRQDLRTLQQVLRLLRRYRPHIVHTHTAKAGFVGRVAARLARVPIVVHTFHGHVFKGYFSPAKTRAFLTIEKRLASLTDCIIVLSEQQREEILRLGIGQREQYRIIPLGLDLAPFACHLPPRGGLRAELGIAATTPLVGIVARLVPIKAIPLFLAAARRVLCRYPQALFLIVGDGELRAQLQGQAMQLGLSHAVRFLGFRRDLPRLYADLDCVVLCSLNEGLPVAIIEALASARPVVATDVGSVRQLLCDGAVGTLVPPGDEARLAEGIIHALDEPEEAARRAQAGREHVYPTFDTPRLIRDIETLYGELLIRKQLLRTGENLRPSGESPAHHI